MQHLSYEGRLRETGFQPEAAKAQRDLANVYKYLMGRNEEGPRLLALAADRTRGSGYKFKQ